jgi:threonine dehydratase
VRQVGEETFRLCRELVDEVVRVDADAVCAAIKDVFEDTRSILEPAGALSVAGMKAWAAREGCADATLVAVACGANMNFDRLRFVAERAEVGEAREAVFAVTVPEERGSSRRFCATLDGHGVTEFNYRIADDELAKQHLRHMIGGRSERAGDELLYRFEFPERPGALMRFLSAMSPNWNISLFHYRNEGADYGRILVGIQVPPVETAEFRAFLATLGYPHSEETGNPAYRLFLRGG